MVVKLLNLALTICQSNEMIFKSVGFNTDKNIVITCIKGNTTFHFIDESFEVVDIKLKNIK